MDNFENEGPELFEKMQKDWHSLAKGQPSVSTFLNESQTKLLTTTKSPSIVAFFNPKLDFARFLVEDSDGRKGQAADGQLPKTEFSGGQSAGPSTGFADNSDPFEDALEDALCVFKSGNNNTDVLERNKKNVMFYVDLENELIVEKNASSNEMEDDGFNPEQALEHKHPMLLNQYPLCDNHSLFLLFPDDAFPQVLSDEIVLLLLQLFKLTDQPSLRIGYDSMGADCAANNLHVHVIYADCMFKKHFESQGQSNSDEMSPGEIFPIELAVKKEFFRTTLQHLNKEEINMFNIPVRFGELSDDWPMKVLVLAPEINDEELDEANGEDAKAALAHTAGIVLNFLIDQNIPHNILIGDDGMTIYIIPRKFDMLIEKVQFFTSFETLCGFIKFKSETAYEKATHEDISAQLKQYVSINDEDFERMKLDLLNKFQKEYEVEVMK